MITLDELDRKILAQVQRNASIPLEDLGQKVGLSRNACWRRLKSLEENGVITGYAQDVKACALGQAAAAILGAQVLGRDRAQIDRLRS